MAKKRTNLIEPTWPWKQDSQSKSKKCPECGRPAGISFGYDKTLHFCAQHAMEFIKRDSVRS